VAGCKEAIEDLQEIVDVLKNPDRYMKIGARTPRGALLVGPPGTGKTLLARAVAGEAGVPFFSAAGSDFVEMYVGVGAQRVRDVFERAKKEERAIIFIDEIDAIGRKRQERAVSGGEQESENTLIALLNELDGFKGSGVIVLAATNRPDVLDSALCRPGRLDRRVHVGLPDAKEREAILQVHLRNKPLESGINIGSVAARTPGVSGAQLEQICNEAALIAAREAAALVTQAHLASAVEYVSMGRARKSASISEHDRKVTAWHEAGHALAALLLPDAQDPAAVSITPRGQAGGVTWMTGSESHLTTRAQLRAQLSVALAGRAAEELLMSGEHTSGAFSDLQQASDIARHMVDRFGMTGRGLLVRAASDGADSENAAEQLLQDAMTDVRSLLEDNISSLEAIAARLLEVEDITGDDVKALVSSFNATLSVG
jgi:cell division protease FtsH